MDKKYKAIKTLSQLDLSRGARSSLSSTSGKSDFLSVSAEKRFNEAYAKDFSISPPKKDKVLLPKLRPRKLLPIKTETKTKTETKPKDTIKNKRLPNLYEEWLNKEWEIGIPVDSLKTDRFHIDKVQRNLLTHIKDEKLKEWVKKRVKEIKKRWKEIGPDILDPDDPTDHLYDLIDFNDFKK